MENLTTPQIISGPFAYNGQKNEIPDAPTGDARASVQEGFPPITFLPEEDGGEAPFGQDFNGLGNLLSQFYYFKQNGGAYTFNQAVAEVIGGYPENALLWYFPDENNVTAKWLRSTKPNNMDNFITNPEVIGISWVEQNNQQSILPPTSIVTFDHPVDFGGLLPLNSADFRQGYLIENCDTSYPDFWEKMLEYKQLGASDAAYARYTKTQQQYTQELTANGFCGFYVINEAAKTVRLPYLGDSYLQGGASNAIDRIAGLPSISHTHNHRHGLPGADSSCAGGGRVLNVYGASDSTTNANYRQSSFDATANSSVSNIYGRSDTVQTDSVGVFFYIVVANSWKDVSIEDFTARLETATSQELTKIDDFVASSTEAFNQNAIEKQSDIDNSVNAAQSWAVGTIAERPEGSAKYWAERLNPDSLTPAGMIIAWPVSTPPEGYLICNGAVISRTTYKNLFKAIGTNFGAGDGSTTFKIPDFRGDFLRGYLQGTSAEVNDRQEEGLPDIAGRVVGNSKTWIADHTEGCFFMEKYNETYGGTSAHTLNVINVLSFQAWQYNHIYGNSNHVTPRNNAVFWCIKY